MQKKIKNKLIVDMLSEYLMILECCESNVPYSLPGEIK